MVIRVKYHSMPEIHVLCVCIDLHDERWLRLTLVALHGTLGLK